MYCGESSVLSNSQIARAADEAFSSNRRLDTFYAPTDSASDLNRLCSTNNKGRLQLKKRKNQYESENAFSTDFVSGLFRDLSEAEHHDDCDGYSDVNEVSYCVDGRDLSPRRKRVKTSGDLLSLSRSCKSISCLTALSNCNDDPARDSGSDPIVVTSSYDDSSPHGRRVSLGKHSSSLYSDATINTDFINNLVDKVLVETLAFPRLPPTVSETSCSSNNLTQTSVHAAQVIENPSISHIEGDQHDHKDTYGWFVDIELDDLSERADVVSAAQESCLALGSADDLSFRAFTAPKKTVELDEEVEWAKAADTVDDVLGDFF